jgi:hypothetical protein
MNTNNSTYEYILLDLLKSFHEAGIRILNPNKYFNNYYVKCNFGIESFKITIDYSAKETIIFTLKDPKKFFTKIIKYGIV